MLIYHSLVQLPFSRQPFEPFAIYGVICVTTNVRKLITSVFDKVSFYSVLHLHIMQ